MTPFGQPFKPPTAKCEPSGEKARLEAVGGQSGDATNELSSGFQTRNVWPFVSSAAEAINVPSGENAISQTIPEISWMDCCKAPFLLSHISIPKSPSFPDPLANDVPSGEKMTFLNDFRGISTNLSNWEALFAFITGGSGIPVGGTVEVGSVIIAVGICIVAEGSVVMTA